MKTWHQHAHFMASRWNGEVTVNYHLSSKDWKAKTWFDLCLESIEQSPIHCLLPIHHSSPLDHPSNSSFPTRYPSVPFEMTSPHSRYRQTQPRCGPPDMAKMLTTRAGLWAQETKMSWEIDLYYGGNSCPDKIKITTNTTKFRNNSFLSPCLRTKSTSKQKNACLMLPRTTTKLLKFSSYFAYKLRRKRDCCYF